MGRNAGSKVFWTHLVRQSDANHYATWYCQQHAKWDSLSGGNRVTVFEPLVTQHLNDQHGNAEQ